MKNDNYILSIDIGNTRTHLGVIDRDACQCLKTVAFHNSEFDSRFSATLNNLKSEYNLCKANISSCVTKLLKEAEDFSKTQLESVSVLKVHSGLPVVFNYQNPEKLGTDRIADALACSMLFADRSCVKIGSGSAVTVDFLEKGVNFEGGAIFAGVEMHFRTLHSSTDALPSVNLQPSPAAVLPGKSTSECIRAGVLYSTAGAMMRIVAEYREKYGDDLIVAATGGAWELTSAIVDFDFTYIPELTLIGVGLYED